MLLTVWTLNLAISFEYIFDFQYVFTHHSSSVGFCRKQGIFKVFETMVIRISKSTKLIFIWLENIYSDFSCKIFRVHSFELFVLPNKALLRQANGIVCLMREHACQF